MGKNRKSQEGPVSARTDTGSHLRHQEVEASDCQSLFVCLRLALRSYSILNCSSPSNAGGPLGGLLFDGKLGDSLLDSLMEGSSPAGLCPPMQVPPPFPALTFTESEATCLTLLLGSR